MNDSVDPVQHVSSYPSSDKVRPTQKSNPDRKRKFADELDDELEKKDKKRKRRNSDEVLIDEQKEDRQDDDGRDSDDGQPHQPEPTGKSESSGEDETKQDGGVDITA